MVCKGSVVDWFKGLSASNRIDTMCTLLDHCLSFELRFLGTVIENLGKRDFNELRGAAHKANSFFVDNANDRITILNLLSEPPIAAANSNCPYNVQNPIANSLSSHHQFHNNVDTSTSINRPSATHTTERKTRSPGPGGGQSQPLPHATESHLPSIGSLHISSDSPYASAGGKTGHHMASANTNATSVITNCIGNSGGGGGEEEEYKSDSSILTDDIRRRKLITYLLLLNATNLDCAKAYFGVLSEIKDVLNVLGWMEGLDETTLEEMALLFTIANNHPAFTFDQRTFLEDIMTKFQSQITKMDVAVEKNYQQAFVLPPQANNYYFIPHYVSQGQAPPGTNNPTPENGRILAFAHPYQLQMMMPYHPQPLSQQPAHPYAQNLVGAAISPQAAAGSPVTPTQSIIQQQPVPLPGLSSSSSFVPQFAKPQQAGSQSQQSSVSTPTRTSSMASAVTAFQSQTNSLDGNESEECAWDSPESSPFESPPQSLTPSRSDSPTASQTNTVTQSSVSSPTPSAPHSALSVASNSSTLSNSVPESLCSTTSIANVIGSGIHCPSSAVGLNLRMTKPGGIHAVAPLPVMHGQEVSAASKTLSMNMCMNGLKLTMPDRRTSKLLANNMSYHSNPNPTSNQLLSSMVCPLPGTSTSSGLPSITHGMTPTLSNNPSSQQHSCHSQPYIVHSSQSQPVNNGGYSSGNSANVTNVSAAASSRTVSVSSIPITSIMNSGNSLSNSVSASAYNHLGNSIISSGSYHHPVAMSIPQSHHPQSNTNSDCSSTGYSTLKGCISVPPPLQSHTLLKSVNAGSNPSSTMNSTTMLPSPQMMGQVQVQVQNPPPTVVNSVGGGTHSISTNPPLVAYQHGPLTHGGPQVNNYGGVAGYSNVGAPPSYSSMGFRSPNNQQALINRAAYLPQHSNSMINNQMVMKQQDQRSHNLNPNLSHGRPKTNNSAVQAQSTPKRRNNTSSSNNTNNSSSSNVGSNGGNQHLQNKGEDTTVQYQ